MSSDHFIVGNRRYDKHASGFYFPCNFVCTSPAVIDAIVNAAACKTRVRLFLGDTATGAAWPEEFDVIGTIGRSMGPCRVPLLINNARSTGGAPISVESIVAIFNTRTGHAIYRHPQFNPGVWTICAPASDGYFEAVAHNDATHAQFKKPGQAGRYCAFMRGTRFAK